ncbi:MAG: 30S ribosomal protein S9 [Candidatus Aenigmarchaeota archaeon]|nr:30S ribosomal protein S9 [Candidatus Aenigmarchaeota archaeon]
MAEKTKANVSKDDLKTKVKPQEPANPEVKKEIKPEAKKAETKPEVKKEVLKQESAQEKKEPAKEAPKPEAKAPEKKHSKPKVPFHTTGKRKKSVARAVIRNGSGKVKVNYRLIENSTNEVFRLRIMEPLVLSGSEWKKYDFQISVRGGGVMGQADAIRQAIARGLVELFGPGLKAKFMEYDRNLIAYDPRRTEPHKPPRSSQGPRRYKQRSKR